MDLSIIVVNFNTKSLIKECLSSIFKNTQNLKYEVIVVDNHSSDGSPEMVKKDFPQVKLIQNKENLGFAKANNQGLKVAEGKYISFLNSDTVVLSNAFETLVRILEKNSQIGLLGPLLLNKKGKIQISARKRFPSLFSVFVEYFFPLEQFLIRTENLHPSDFGKKAHLRNLKVAHLMGACLLTKKEILEKIRGFDERFFLFLEETDLAKKIKQAGYQIIYTPRAKIVHLGRSSIKKWPAASSYYINSLFKYFSKYHQRQRQFLPIVLFLASFFSIIFLTPAFLFLFWHPRFSLKIFNYLKNYFFILGLIFARKIYN
jgi:hypothetical protein